MVPLINLQIGLFRSAGAPMWVELNFQFYNHGGDFDLDWFDNQIQGCIEGDQSDTQYLPVLMWQDQSTQLDWTYVNIKKTMKNVHDFVDRIHNFEWM